VDRRKGGEKLETGQEWRNIEKGTGRAASISADRKKKEGGEKQTSLHDRPGKNKEGEGGAHSGGKSHLRMKLRKNYSQAVAGK